MVATSLPALFDLSGQCAFITGGGGGIGAATGRLLAEAGAVVVMADRDAASTARVVDELRSAGHGAEALVLDVTDETAVERAFARFEDSGGFDILVNNAGVSIRKALHEISLEEWDRVLSVNVTGAFLCSRAAIRAMKRKKRGAIVNVASIMGLSGGATYPNPSYQASKGALVNFTRALAIELAPFDIRANAVAPTWVRTSFIGELIRDSKNLKKIESLMPLRRLAEADEVAAAVLFLASPASAMTTGAILPVDGGFLAQ